MLDVVKLLQAGQPVFGLLLIVVSLLLGLACAAAGFQLSRRVFNA
jgi:CrcB protein